MRYILKVSPETIIKSRSVRNWHFKQLRRNIIKILKMTDITFNTVVYSDRFEVNCDDADADLCKEKLSNIPGIHSILTVDTLDLPDENPIEFIANKSIDYYSKKISGKSFAVRCKRSGNHSFSSAAVEREVGSALFMNDDSNSVNLKHPDVSVTIEIRNKKAYFISEKTLGLGGYPIGTQGPVLSLISGGYDSSVASYHMMRRGCRTNFLFFNLGGTAHAIGAQQAALFLWSKFGSSHNAIFHTVSLESFVAELMELPNKSLNGVLLKRAMLKVGEMIANKYKTTTLVTGESIAQVSSQTLANLAVIDRGTEHLVLRPLITTDKREIIDTAEKIGSAIFAQNMVEYCGVISNKPTVAASLSEVKAAEEAMGNQWFYDALSSAKHTKTSDIIDELNEQPQIEFVKKVDKQVVIDIRGIPEPALPEADIHIHFYKLNQQFSDLDQSKDYLLFCEKGVMSQLPAAYLHEKGFTNVKVFRPD